MDPYHDLTKAQLYTLDRKITPMMNGDTSLLALHPGRRTGGNLPQSRARFQPGRVLCTAKAAVRRRSRGSLVQCGPLFLLHVFPCVQVRYPPEIFGSRNFWISGIDRHKCRKGRSIQAKDLPVCSSCFHVSSCTRCPGLAYLEGKRTCWARA
jgi:AdoMet-dependent heme synthase